MRFVIGYGVRRANSNHYISNHYIPMEMKL